jgi:hypothetical protein
MAMRLRRAIAFLHTVALCVILPAMARAQTTGTLRGSVVDENGRPLAGATVVIASAGQAVSGRGTVTDAAGAFVIVSLPPARDYVIQAEFPGYAVVQLTGVEIAAGSVTRQPIVLRERAAFRERVEVRALPPIVALERPDAGATLTSEFIDALPILGRDYQDILTLAPGVTDVDGDGNPNIHGSRDTDVITLVDGVSSTDPLTGKLGAELNIESIQEIEIKTAAAQAEFSRGQGGFVNLVTKSGGNDFQGAFKFYWRGSTLDGDGAGIDDPELHSGLGEAALRDLEFDDYLTFVSFSGPIVRDHAWFFFTHEDVRLQEPVNAVSNAFVTGVRQSRDFLKLTWQASTNNRVAFSVNYDPQEYLNQGLNSFTSEESGYTEIRGGPLVTARVVSVLSPYVSLESLAGWFDERPSRSPTLHPDGNGNGILARDFNGNGFIEAIEADAGEDYDGDGVFDIFEDYLRPYGVLNEGEDRDGDDRVTPPHGCEGEGREDADCDGHLDNLIEDADGNGRLDPGEDIDGDGRLDLGSEDRNGNKRLDDTPRPVSIYPYGRFEPLPADRLYEIDQTRGVITGPYFLDYGDSRRRFTFREDLGVFVPDFWGSHDVRAGLVLESEGFDRTTAVRGIYAPFIRRQRLGPSTMRVLLPAEREVENSATAMVGGIYLQDNFKPFPNLSIGVGIRFDREATDSFGYSSFEPTQERRLFDHLQSLAGAEAWQVSLLTGDGDRIQSYGVLADPIFQSPSAVKSQAFYDLFGPLREAALGRLTRHHIEARFASQELAQLYPELFRNGEIDPERLRELGITPQAQESFRVTNNNLAPRLSVSWDPWSSGRTRLFATWGRYYDKLFLSTLIGEEGPDTINRYYLFNDVDGVNGNGTPNLGIGQLLSKAPPSATQIDRGLETPFSDEFTVGFEREIAPEVALGVRFVERKYRRQLQDIDVNHTLRYGEDGRPLDLIGALGSGALTGGRLDPGVRLPDGRPDLYIYNFFFNQILRIGNYNEARYRALEIEVVKRLSRRWELLGSYTYSRARGAAEEFASRLGNDPSTIESEYGYLDFDQRHVVKLSGMTYLPRDWQLGMAATWSSGLPYSNVSRFFALDSAGYQQYRTVYGSTQRTGDGNTFEFVPEPRNVHRNEAILDLNLRARKAFVIGRTAAAAFIEVFNVLNTDDLVIRTYEPDRPQDAGPVTPEAGGLAGPLQVDGVRRFGRRFQIGLQIDF